MTQTNDRGYITEIVNRITNKRDLFKLAADVGLRGYRADVKRNNTQISTMKDQIATFIINEGINAESRSEVYNKYVELGTTRITSGRPPTKIEALQRAHDLDIDIGSKTNMNTTQILRKIDFELARRESTHDLDTINELNRIYADEWVISYSEKVIRDIHSIFSISPALEEENTFIPFGLEWKDGREGKMYEPEKWVRNNFVVEQYDGLIEVVETLLMTYMNRVGRVFKFKLWQQVLNRLDDGTYSIITTNITKDALYSRFSDFNMRELNRSVVEQMDLLWEFSDENMNAYVVGSTFQVELYSPIRVDIILEEPEHGNSIGDYIEIPSMYSNRVGIINIKQDVDWSKNKCFLLCVGFSIFIRDMNIDKEPFSKRGGMIISADYYSRYLRAFVEDNEIYSHIDKYGQMIKHKYPSMVINVFFEDENGGSTPMIYRRFGVRDNYKPENEINLLLVGDIANAMKDTIIERSHVFLLLDVDRFFMTRSNHKLCRNCAKTCHIDHYKKHYEECIIGNLRHNVYNTPQPTEKKFKNEEGEIEVEVVYPYKVYDEYDLLKNVNGGSRSTKPKGMTDDEFIASLYTCWWSPIPYKHNKHKYMMAADFETDNNSDREMYGVQFGIAGSYLDQPFHYYDNRDDNVNPFKKMFEIAKNMAYHNYNQQLFDKYFNEYLVNHNGVDEVISIEDYYWHLDGYNDMFTDECNKFNEFGVKLIEKKTREELNHDQDIKLKMWNYKNVRKMANRFAGFEYVELKEEEREKHVKEMNDRFKYKKLRFSPIEIPLFFLNGIKFDNTLFLNSLDLPKEWEVKSTIASSASNFKEFVIKNNILKVKIRVMDIMSFKPCSLEKFVEGYYKSGKEFPIMKRLGINTFDKLPYPYKINEMHNDERDIKCIKIDDFIKSGDTHTIYYDNHMTYDEEFIDVEIDDYKLIKFGMEILKEIKKLRMKQLEEEPDLELPPLETVFKKSYDKFDGENGYNEVTRDEDDYFKILKISKERKHNSDTFGRLLIRKGLKFIVRAYKMTIEEFTKNIEDCEKCVKYNHISDIELIKRRDKFLSVCEKSGVNRLCDAAWYYLKCDVYQLLECCRIYRDEIMEQTELNPYAYVSSHAHGFDWGLKKSGLKYYYLNDSDYYRELKNKCYGGLSCTYTREFKDSPTNTIFEFDATSMYPSSMLDGLPVRLIDTIDYNLTSVDDIQGVIDYCVRDSKNIYLFKVDTSYDPARYGSYWKFPPRIAKRKFDKNGNVVKTTDIGCEKLTNDLLPSKDDIYELEYLIFMMRIGVVVDKLTRVDKYEKTYCVGSNFIEPIAAKRAEMKTIEDYCSNGHTDISELDGIDLNESELKFIQENPRGAAQIYKLRSDELKLTMNSFYGKSIEDVENRSNNDIVSNVKKVAKLASSPLFIEYKILTRTDDEGETGGLKPLYFVKKRQNKILLNKPIPIGKVILDRAKMSLMKFVYDELFRVYGYDRVHIGCTDTDSVHVMIEGDKESVYNDFSKFNCVFDNSKVSVERGSYLRDDTHAGELGSWKNEGKGVTIKRAVYVRPKQYCEDYVTMKKDVGGVEKVKHDYCAKAKGIPKYIIKSNAEQMFFPSDNEYSRFKSEKIGKDHKNLKMRLIEVNKKLGGREEDKVQRNRVGDYRPWGTLDIILQAMEQGVDGANEWLSDYHRFKNAK